MLKMTRFVMSIPEAVNLILKAGKIAEVNEVFILKMLALNIVDLAEVMIDVLLHDMDSVKIKLK
jgi:FlaA1/EpsC-like NDP-sugar epimerase